MNTQKHQKNSGRVYAAHLAAVVLVGFLVSLIGCSGASVTPREGSIQGKIVNVGGRAVEDALVSWEYDRTRWSLTDENGDYLIDGVGFGDQLFNVEAFGYSSSRFAASIFSGQVTSAASHTIEAKSFDYLEIKVAEVSATHVVITWKTTDYTNGLIEYGEKESLGRTVREEANSFATTHSLRISDLSPQKQYFFKIVANREGRSAETSPMDSFTTQSSLEDKSPPSAPSGVSAALTSIPGQVTVFWAPVADPDLKGYKVYRSELVNATFNLVSNMLIAKGQERYTDFTVVSGKKYFYRVTAIDQAGNESGFNNLAGMMVPGDVSTEIRWTRANSPYLVSGDLNILPTGKLTIDAGVEVLIAESDSFRRGDENRVEITVEGAIVASAGNDLPVVFASARTNAEKSDWSGISFKNVENPANTLVNVIISDASTGVQINNSLGTFSQIDLRNCLLGAQCESTQNLTVEKLMITRCTTGIELKSNQSLILKDSTFIHPTLAINSQQNDELTVTGCNLLEFTENGMITNENGGVIEITNNLFVSPQGTALKILTQNPVVEYNTFDSPYAIQINQSNPVIRKNIFLSQRSVFGTGKKGIEHLSGSLPLPVFGPNNIVGFANDLAYRGCTPSTDSLSTEVLLMMQLNGETYDYRLRQPFPDNEDPWGIQREEIPYDN